MASRKRTHRKLTGGQSRSNEIVAVFLLALAVLVFLCLATYHPNDWSLNTESTQQTQNWIGVVGSIIADLLFQGIGLAGYFLPVLLGLMAWRSFRAEKIKVSVSRIVGYLMFIISTASLAALAGLRGGIAGVFFADIFAFLVGTIGAGILLSAFLLMSVILVTNISFASFLSNFEMAWQNFQIRLSEWFTGYGKWRERRHKAALERMDRRRRAVQGETEAEEMPTISTGDEKLDLTPDKKEKVSDKVAAVLKSFGTDQAETSPDTASPAAETGDETDRTETSPGAEESAFPETAAAATAASGAEKSAPVPGPAAETEPETARTGYREDEKPEAEEDAAGRTADSPPDLVAEAERIPIQPRQENGDGTDEEEAAEKSEDGGKPQDFSNYLLPRIGYLTRPPARIEQKEDELLAVASNLTEKTKEFNVTGQVKNIGLGPVVTTYEFKPDPGVKYSRVTNLVDDLCLALKAESIRIERIPGKAVVGIEVPNKERETIYLRDVIESKEFSQSKSPLTIALGKKIDGKRQVADLARMPHLLIAGATGSGKSVGVNSLIVSILYKAKPDEVKFIMVDPKRLELGLYADIPHLATPIITDPKRAALSLKWAVSEMERRYKHLAGWGVRNIDGYNEEVRSRNDDGITDENDEPWKPLPYIVIIIDELADLMMVSGKEVEASITRLAQMARAVGIHLVLATQRPSVDVITGLIKANFPARISFRVSSKIDSRTIIDTNGAESLLGKGDMLFLPPATSQIIRVHGAFVDEKEIQKIVKHIKEQGNPEYDETITKSEEELDDSGDLPGRTDKLFGEALRTVVSSKRASTSLLQRHLRIGYGRAAAILDALVAEGYIGEMDGTKRARPVLDKAYEAVQEMEEGREI